MCTRFSLFPPLSLSLPLFSRMVMRALYTTKSNGFSYIELSSTAKFILFSESADTHARRERARQDEMKFVRLFATRDRSVRCIYESFCILFFLRKLKAARELGNGYYAVATSSSRCIFQSFIMLTVLGASSAILLRWTISEIFLRPNSPSISCITIPFLRSSWLPFIKFTTSLERRGVAQRMRHSRKRIGSSHQSAFAARRSQRIRSFLKTFDLNNKSLSER